MNFKLKQLNTDSELIRKSSIDAATKFSDGSIDLIYIDGDHTYDSVINDLNAWWHKVNPENGIISGDDLNWQGVKDACDDFFGEKKLKYATIHKIGFEDSPIWFYSFNKEQLINSVEGAENIVISLN